MKISPKPSQEIFSFHLAKVPLLEMPRFLLRPPSKENINGLKHAESLFTMNLDEPIVGGSRYNLKTLALFAWWSEEKYLSEFLNRPSYKLLRNGWHVRMKLYRRWGEVAELKEALVEPDLGTTVKPVVALTLARLRISETLRFIKWGKPVERQVKNHLGQNLALAAMRPINTFSTFSIWKSESEMVNMVSGRNVQGDGESHVRAMKERTRKDFHYEFTTMRFTPFKEVGIWNGKSNYTA